MHKGLLPDIDDRWIISRRGTKNKVDPEKPYAIILEGERMPSGKVEDVATIFLTNRECPFKCLMCDLWKNTTDDRVASGMIPAQIDYALNRLPQVKHLKLYNSGNFFDVQAIPPEDYRTIAGLLRGIETVIVESHPKLINERNLQFRDMLQCELQIAMGLETIHPDVLPRLNKRMKVEDFRNAVHFLTKYEILARAFILLRPPFLTEEEGILWARKSIKFAFESGVECCVVIPTRSGNGAMEWLEEKGHFSRPRIDSLEEVLDYGIELGSGRVFADLWDLQKFSTCKDCFSERKKRLKSSNFHQLIQPKVSCHCSSAAH